MSMGTLGKAMKRTRTRIIESQTDDVSRQFSREFGMRDGDYVEYEKMYRGELIAARGRIVSVSRVWFNLAGGWSASVWVVPLLSNGRLGCTKEIDIRIDADGGGLRCIRYGALFRRITTNDD